MSLAVANPNPAPPPSDPDDETPPPLSGELWWPGALVKHFTYDGLGRLAEVQSPYPDPQTANGGGGQIRTERYSYDGIRRIQELVIDPVPTLEVIVEGGGEGFEGGMGLMQAATQLLDGQGEEAPVPDGQSLPVSVEAVHLDQSGVLLGEGSGAGAQSQLITGPFGIGSRRPAW